MSFFSWLSGGNSGRGEAEVTAPSSSSWMQRVDHKLDLLLQELNIRTPDGIGNVMSAEIRNLASTGQKIQAIKLYRDMTGATLSEAKAAVEGLAPPVADIEAKLDLILREFGIKFEEKAAVPAASADSEMEEMIRKGDMIMAIKRYREVHGTGLKESKEAVEQIQRDLRSNR